MLLGPPHQTGGARLLQHRVQALHFGRRDALAEPGEPIVATPFVAAGRIGAFAELLDHPLLEHPANRTVQRAGAQLHLALGPGGDVLHDRVAVAIAIGERDQDVEHGRGQREQRCGVRVVHAANYTTIKYSVVQYNLARTSRRPPYWDGGCYSWLMLPHGYGS